MVKTSRTDSVKKKPVERGQDLRELVSFKLRLLTTIYTKSLARAYGQRFGLTINEWRLLAQVQFAGKISMNSLAEQAQFDRGLTSRTVFALVKRGYITRRVDTRDARGVQVSLTAAGKRLFAEMIREAHQRNELLLSSLTRSERDALMEILAKLIAQAEKCFAV